MPRASALPLGIKCPYKVWEWIVRKGGNEGMPESLRKRIRLLKKAGVHDPRDEAGGRVCIHFPSIFHPRPPPSRKRRAHILRPPALASLRPPRNTSQTLRSSFRHGQHPPQRRSKFPLHPRRAHQSARTTRVQRRVVAHIPSLGFDIPGSVRGRRR